MNRIQLQALIWLRWRLTVNQWRRGGEINAIITIVAVYLGLVLAAVGGVAGVGVGALALPEASPSAFLMVWDGLVLAFLFFWTLGIIIELQRSEILDLSRLLHLPVSLWDAFLLNFLASHFSFSLAMTVPVMLGLTIGLTWGRGPEMLWLLPLAFGFLFMITAWTYCLRGWLASLMTNKRRRRAIIIGVTMGFVLLTQLPNLLMQFGLHRKHEKMPQTPAEMQAWSARQTAENAQWVELIDRVHGYVPLLWLPQGARMLAEGRVWPALAGALGMTAIGAFGLAWSYRGTVRCYRQAGSKKLRPPPAAAPAFRAGKKLFVERTLPGVPEEAAAMTLASLRSLSRAPEVKMALATNVIIFAVMGASIIFRRSGAMPTEVHPLAACAAVAVTFLGLTQLMFNHFGFDRAGFRALVLLPAPRRYFLLGKNLAMLPVAFLVFAIYLGLAAAIAGLGAGDILAAIFEFGGAFLALSAMGNFTSIVAPYRIAAGSLRPTKTKGLATLLIFATHMFFPLVMLPVFIPAGLGLLFEHLGWLPRAAVTIFCAAFLASLALLLFWRTLEPLGKMLQRREQKILEVVTREVE
jgi:ABC-2 type transport system permease protein